MLTACPVSDTRHSEYRVRGQWLRNCKTGFLGCVKPAVGPIESNVQQCLNTSAARRMRPTSAGPARQRPSVWFVIECGICPGLMANVWRRLLLKRLHAVDAIDFCAPTLGEAESFDLLHRLGMYFADLEERDAVSEADAQVFETYRQVLSASAAAIVHH